MAYLLRLLLILSVCALEVVHAADGPGLFDSLGKLLAPVPATDSRSINSPAPGQPRRIALVIGNGNYHHADSLPTLANPTNDAQDIAEILRGFGFEVIERRNQTLEAMNQTIAEFGSKIGGSEAALFYFAGHGIQVKNQNYLMPVNAKIDSEATVPYQGVNVNQILDEMDNAKSAVNIVMLDACRNNPISGKFRSGKSRGLAAPGGAPKGTVIVYATDPGNVASDGDGRNGLFTAGLLTAFKGSDLSLDGILTAASEYVEQRSAANDPDQRQTPYVNGPKTVQKNFNFRITIDPGKGEIEKTFWSSIERSTDPADFEAYLRKYPKGSYRALAENRLKQLKTSQAMAPAAAKPTPAPISPAAPVTAQDPETQFWNEVKASGAKEYFDAYLKQYPKGKYVALAKVELKKIDDRQQQEAQQAEQQAWERAKSSNTAAAYADYLSSYPKGNYAVLAQAAQQKVQRESAEQERQATEQLKREQADAALREESELWKRANAATDNKTVQGYLDRYLKQYPAGRYAAAARLKFAQIEKGSEGTSTVYFYRPSGLVGWGADSYVELPGGGMGKLPNATYFVATVPSGTHRIAVKHDYRLESFTLDFEPGKTYYVKFEYSIGKTHLRMAAEEKAREEMQSLEKRVLTSR